MEDFYDDVEFIFELFDLNDFDQPTNEIKKQLFKNWFEHILLEMISRRY